MSGLQTTPLPLTDERLRVTIEGQNAETTLAQTYKNTSGTQLEGRYRLRPGTGAHVDGFAYWNGEQKIVGEVFEKDVARKVYNNVVDRGRDPGLLEQEGEGQFTFKVFPIAANELKKVELRWSRFLQRSVKTVRYRAPLAHATPVIEIDIIGPAKNVRVQGHALDVTQDAAGITHLRSRGQAAAKAGTELVVEWDVDDAAWTPATWVHPGDAANPDGWFTIALAAPDLPATAIAPKDVTIVIDHSGSMSGEPMAHAKAAAANMIRMLDRRDRVNVIAFDDDVDPLFSSPQALAATTRDKAVAFTENLHESGGTDIGRALAKAIELQEGSRPRVIVFMTDGQSDVASAIEAVGRDKGDVRVFTVGLGKNVNKPFLNRLAAVKRGRFLYIEQAANIEGEVARLATQIARPLLVDVALEVEGGVASRIYPRTLPDLFAEDQLVISGRIKGNGITKLVVKGKLEGKAVAFTRTIDLGRPAKRPWVGRQWAHARVGHLLEEIELGGQGAELKTEVIELALAYNFVTPYTSFLAIPESELGDQQATLEAARAHKRDVIAKHQEVTRLDKVDGDAGDDDEADADASPRDYARSMNASPTATADYEGVTTHKRGCAGCSSGDGAGALLLFALLGLRVRRRR